MSNQGKWVRVFTNELGRLATGKWWDESKGKWFELNRLEWAVLSMAMTLADGRNVKTKGHSHFHATEIADALNRRPSAINEAIRRLKIAGAIEEESNRRCIIVCPQLMEAGRSAAWLDKRCLYR